MRLIIVQIMNTNAFIHDLDNVTVGIGTLEILCATCARLNCTCCKNNYITYIYWAKSWS